MKIKPETNHTYYKRQNGSLVLTLFSNTHAKTKDES